MSFGLFGWRFVQVHYLEVNEELFIYAVELLYELILENQVRSGDKVIMN